MASLIDIYKKGIPSTGKANLKGGDVEPVGATHPYKPSKDLSVDEKALKKARGGNLNTKKYSDGVNK